MIQRFGNFSFCVFTRRNQRRPSIYWQIVNSLSSEDKITWDKLIDQGKPAIMFASKPSDTKKKNAKPTMPECKANLKETILVY